MSQPSPADVGKLLRAERSVAVESFFAAPWYPQQQEWIAEPEKSDSVAYNYPLPLRIRGRLVPRALELALREIVRRHEVFRSSFHLRDGEQLQVVLPARDFAIHEVDLSELTPQTTETLCRNLMMDDANRPFDLRFDLLLRATLVRLAYDDHILLLTTHHSVCDDWSAGILLNELFELYGAFARGTKSTLLPLGYSYREFAQKLAERMRDQKFETHFLFWKEQFRDGHEFYHLRGDHPRRGSQVSPAAHLTTVLPVEISQGIQTLSQRSRVSFFMVLAGAFQCVLARLSRDEDVGVGVCAANRDGTEVEKLIGPFSNRILLRTNFAGDPTFREVLNRVRSSALDAYSNQHVPFGEVVKTVGASARSDRHPLFQVLLIMKETDTSAVESPATGLDIRHFPFEPASTRYDLNVWLRMEEFAGLTVSLQYNAALFDGETMQRILAMYSEVLSAMAENPEARVFELAVPGGSNANRAPLQSLAKPKRTPPRDETESQLQLIWARVFGVNATRIAIDEDYFELGGDSLKAAQLFMQIEKEFRVRFAISVLLEARTIEALAKLIRESAPYRKRTALVSVNGTGSRPPIFCVHTHTGSVLFCRDFPKQLGPDQPVYGLQSQGVSGGSPQFSVEQMAGRYIEELKNVQPDGPYRLFGYSFGGLVAFEMACRLSQSGGRIAFLGMFNTPVPGSLKGWPLRQTSYLQKRIGNELNKLQAFDVREKICHVLRNSWNFSHMVLRSMKTDAWRIAARVLTPRAAKQLAECMLDVGDINIAAAKKYQPSAVFSERITFFLTKQVPFAYSPGPEAGWSPLAAGGVEIVHIPDAANCALEERFARTVCERIKFSIGED
jgi:thioesterase domain-containing protein/acyl carrier protein